MAFLIDEIEANATIELSSDDAKYLLSPEDEDPKILNTTNDFVWSVSRLCDGQELVDYTFKSHDDAVGYVRRKIEILASHGYELYAKGEFLVSHFRLINSEKESTYMIYINKINIVELA